MKFNNWKMLQKILLVILLLQDSLQNIQKLDIIKKLILKSNVLGNKKRMLALIVNNEEKDYIVIKNIINDINLKNKIKIEIIINNESHI